MQSISTVLHNRKLEFVEGDITLQEVDAIVNAANSRLAGGGGVDGAIHSRGGSAIMAETRRKYPDGCPTGSAVISNAGKLPAKYVIHAVGPVWNGGEQGEADLLRGAYQRCLELAVEHRCASIAFPAISTGVYGYPVDLASRVAIDTVIDFRKAVGKPNLVRFVLFNQSTYESFAETLRELITGERGPWLA